MVRVTYSPYREVVIHEILEKTPEELFSAIVQQAHAQGAVGITPSIQWARGVAFSVGFFPQTEEIVRDSLQGKIHYGTVMFTSIPQFKPDVSVRVLGTEHRIRLVNAESNQILADVASFLSGRSWTKEGNSQTRTVEHDTT
ncbi:MAG TPA: hypothetical protein VFF30_05780 [Nitrososphaerales archaeon]|nr:hypothetical protein [Nitrososphaerales archaeon]